MPLAAGTKTYFSFVRGIVTEASELLYPENSAIDIDNFVINRDGSIQRRKGLDYEVNYTFKDTGVSYSNSTDAAVGVYRWDNAGNDPDVELAVVQYGTKLWFYDAYQAPLTSTAKNSGVALDIGGSGSHILETAVVNGILVVTGADIAPKYFEYASDGSITMTDVAFRVRDFWGVDDGLPVSARPSTLTDLHKYNLLNQGWKNEDIVAYYAAKKLYPSNSDIPWVAQNAEYEFDPDLLDNQYFGNARAPQGKFILEAFNRGSSRSGQAQVSIDRAGTERLNGIFDPVYTPTAVTDIPTDMEQGKFTSCAAFAGRVFYAGVRSNVMDGDDESPNYSGYVFFSQLVDNAEDLGKCYQEADPTAEQINELVDTDGGYVRISEAFGIKKLVATERSLLVFADNGVWEITGTLDSGFSATSYQVIKVTDIGLAGGQSVVNAEGTIFYWGKGGIYVVTNDPVSQARQIQSITESTIQTKYDGIGEIYRQHAKGYFDPSNRKVVWLYSDDPTFDGYNKKHKYNRELVFDLLLGAFYTNTIPSLSGTNQPYIAGAYIVPGYTATTYDDNVTVDGTNVTASGVQVTVAKNALTSGHLERVTADGVRVTAGGTQVTVTSNDPTRTERKIKYLLIDPDRSGNVQFTFGGYNNDQFVDWYTQDDTGVDYQSYLITGYEIVGDSTLWKQAIYVTFHFRKTETGYVEDANGDFNALHPSSCLFRARWDFADSRASGKWGVQKQAYRHNRLLTPASAGEDFDNGFAVITTRNKIRGRGRALSLRLDSEAGKDMVLLGWAIPFIAGEAT